MNVLKNYKVLVFCIVVLLLISITMRIRSDFYWRGRFALTNALASTWGNSSSHVQKGPLTACDWKRDSSGVFEIKVTAVSPGRYNTPTGEHPELTPNSNFHASEWLFYRLITATVIDTFMTDGATGSVVLLRDAILPDVEMGTIPSQMLHQEYMTPFAEIEAGDMGVIFPLSYRHFTDTDYYESSWSRPDIAPIEEFERSLVLELRANGSSDATLENVFNWYWYEGDYAISTTDSRVMPISQLKSEIEQCSATPRRNT